MHSNGFEIDPGRSHRKRSITQARIGAPPTHKGEGYRGTERRGTIASSEVPLHTVTVDYGFTPAAIRSRR